MKIVENVKLYSNEAKALKTKEIIKYARNVR